MNSIPFNSSFIYMMMTPRGRIPLFIRFACVWLLLLLLPILISVCAVSTSASASAQDDDSHEQGSQEVAVAEQHKETTNHRRRHPLVYVQGSVLCNVTCNGRTTGFPLRGVRVKIECRNDFGEYETLGKSNKYGIYRVILQGAYGPDWPMRFCHARLLRSSLPAICRSPPSLPPPPSSAITKSSSPSSSMSSTRPLTLNFHSRAKFMLAVAPFVFHPRKQPSCHLHDSLLAKSS